MTGRTEVVSAAVDLTEKGGQTDKMIHKKRQLLIRQTKEHLTGLCVMVSQTVHLVTSVQAFVGGHVDTTVEDLQTDQNDLGSLNDQGSQNDQGSLNDQGLMNSQQREPSMVVIVHHDEVDIVGDVVTVLVLETAAKEQMQMMLMARTIVVVMSNK